ncbi:MAG: hypothetical protein ISS72_01290 [Candidatus Brocadiae bacterium]|nr:hypothetical protein [Candidatus Brocadiia bacterium]
MASAQGDKEVLHSMNSDGEDLDFEIDFYKSVLDQVPDCVDVLMALSNGYTRQGQFAEGLSIDERLCVLRSNDPIVRYNLACSHSLLGQYELSIEALRQAVVLGYSDVGFLQKDPDLEGLRTDPRYATLLEQLLGQQPAS